MTTVDCRVEDFTDKKYDSFLKAALFATLGKLPDEQDETLTREYHLARPDRCFCCCDSLWVSCGACQMLAVLRELRLLEPRAQVDLDVAALVEAAVLVELGGPPERGQRAGDGHEASVPHAPGSSPEADDTEDVEQREPSQECQPRALVRHA